MNEDALIVNSKDNVYGVADGATSLTDYRNASGHTGGYIAAHILASTFQQVPLAARLEEVVTQANDTLRKSMLEAGVDIADKRQLWSAAFVLFRVNDTYIDFVQAGDCMLFAKYMDGTYRRVTHDQVAHADRITLQKRREAIVQGITDPAKIREYVYPTLCENRRKANTCEGYAVLNGEPGLSRYLEAGRLSRARLTRLYAITDGLFHCLADVNPDETWTKMLADIDSQSLDTYVANLVRMEQGDPDCSKYPRLKISDDKTGIVLDLG
ncbi:protein phosphatase 2C domain-containing protein [Paenibacillus filicis]|uniref:Protein phosphatase 2C domain-containing protein n=1 Tax=Paenibacillus gyeongsangnamensis TaxID=3388067 RepID=A0ABT4Q3Z0_9BACL|nr:protein phosphatase 2C domain-containing protein [Paenibacillus filicis]MCZ8511594.1 protein phosphatase 2C domain-containing protein [Paenibacillus filicis]